MQQNKWSEEDLNPIEIIKNFKKCVKQNSGILPHQPYITWVVNYAEVRKILTECECYHEIKTSNDEIVIYNVERNPKLYDKSKILYLILELYGEIMFLEHI